MKNFPASTRASFLRCTLVFLFALALRLVWVESWLLPNVDEIVLTNTLQAPILESATASSSYWFPQLIYKTFSPGPGTIPFRYLSAVAGASACLLFFVLLGRVTSAPGALLIALAFSFNWYFLYITRIAEIASLLPVMLTAALLLLHRWDQERSLPALAAAAGLLGLALNTWAPPAAYLSAAVMICLSLELRRRAISLGAVAIAALAWLVTAAPYIVATARSGNLRSELLTRYSFSGMGTAGLIPVALVSPDVPARSWSQLVTVYRSEGPGWLAYCVGAGLLFVGLLLGAQRRRTGVPRLIVRLGVTMLILILVSPLPVYIEGHLFPLLLLLVIVFAGSLQPQVPAWRRLTAASGLAVLMLPSLFFLPRLWADQRGVLNEWLTQEVDAGTVILVSDGASLKLAAYPEFAALRSRLRVFPCDGTEARWHEDAIGHRAVFLTTYECNTKAMFERTGSSAVPGPDLNSLLEASLKHGLRGWVLSRTD